jgi:ABC-2 type transport system ATP-binding protein
MRAGLFGYSRHVDPTTAITCRDLHKRFRATVALAGVTLDVQRGSIFGFLGPNGAGKSTLVKILTGLVRPDTGVVEVLGGRPGTREVQRQVGYLPELFRFPGWLTGREVLQFHAKLAEVTIDASELLDLVGIGGAGGRRVAEYSKGMQQRLGLAQALVGDPPLVFLDEPTSALDPIGRLEVRDVLLHLLEHGTAVFLNSHLLTEVEKVCDRVAVIDRGTIVTQGTTDDLLQTATARIRVGDPDPASLERFMTGLASCRQPGAPEASPATALDHGVLCVKVDSDEEIPALVRRAVEAGLAVYEVGLARRSLEEAFVRLVKDHQDETAAGPAGVPDVAGEAAGGERRAAPDPGEGAA